MARAISDAVKEGDVVAGKFRVEGVVGKGGMGFVVAARNVQLDQRVALKFLSAGIDDPDVVARFSREARAAIPPISTAASAHERPSDSEIRRER